jgi:hypothetical protein
VEEKGQVMYKVGEWWTREWEFGENVGGEA